MGLPNPYGSSYTSEVESLVIVGSDVYAGGACVNSSGALVAGYWKDGNWVGLTNPDDSSEAFVYELAIVGQ